MNLQSLYTELHRAQLTPSAEPPSITFIEDTGPWYTRLLLGFMGWLGGMLVLGFFAALISSLLDSAFILTALAAIMLFAAAALYRAFPKSDFGTQFALAGSICGQVLALIAFGKLVGSSSETTIACFAVALQIVLVWVMPNFLHRLMSTLFTVCALYFASRGGVASVGVGLLIATGFVTLARAESVLVAGGHRAFAEPVWAGLAIGLLIVGVGYLNPFKISPMQMLSTYAVAASATFGAALIFWVWVSLRDSDASRRGAAIAAAITFSAAAWRAPGLIASALVLLVAFSLGRRVLTGFAILGLIGYLSGYYYQVELTLLVKAGVLAASGGILLVCGRVHRQYFSTEAA